jgi:fucose permease
MLLSSLSRFFTRPDSRAIGVIFICDGLFYGSWSAMIPYVRAKFGLDEAQLGLLLFCLPLGVTVSNPLAALMIRRFGLKRSTLGSLAIAAFCFILPVIAPTAVWTAISLVVCGVFFSVLNNTMNTCATILEEQEKIRILSACHGMWSFGAMAGSAFASTLTGLGMTPVLYMSGMVVIISSVAWIVRVPLRRVAEPVQSAENKGAAFSWPTPALWGLIVLSLCTNLTEGAMADWAAVYFRDVLQVAPWLTGYGFAAYAFWMAAGRFTGDAVLEKYDNRRVLQVGGLLVALGLMMAVLVPSIYVTLPAFALVGAGVSLGAPILYGSSARAPGMAPGAGLAVMNTFAMAGFLAGPTFIGFIAKTFSLPGAFALVAVTALFWAWKAGSAKGIV